MPYKARSSSGRLLRRLPFASSAKPLWRHMPRKNRFQHRSRRYAHDVSRYRSQFDVAPLTYLLQSVHHVASILHQVCPLPGQVPQVPLRLRRNVTSSQQTHAATNQRSIPHL